MTQIQIPSPLRPYSGKQASVDVSANTVGEALAGLVTQHPELKRHLYTEEGKLRAFVNVYVNDEDMRYLQKEATTLNDGDTISIVPSIAGGSMIAAEPVAPPALSNDEILRYSRHLIMPEVGMEGQQKLKAAKVLCIGAGGLGSPLALYLTAAGVGTLGIVDFDVVDYTNLQRQIIHSTADVGRKKLDSAGEKLKAINPFLNLRTFDTRLTSANALELFREFDIVADGTDNFPTRYLVNDACVLTGKPNVYGSIFRFEGQASVFATEDGPCYRCLYPEPPPPGLVPSCAEGGVLGILPGLVGVIQATETIKLILGQGDSLVGRLLLVDALGMKFRELKLRKNPDCPVCGTHRTITKLIDYYQFCGIRGAEAAPVTGGGLPEISVEELKKKLDDKEDIFILDVREPHEYQICNLNGHLIPLGDLPKRVGELDSSREIVAHCKMGGRSAKAVAFLQQAGFTKVHNLTGGITAWAERIDTKMPKY
jgi:molybdopterin/thiamine biosynthesis adenylyltransferase/rhodanese-related sulfurtransferase/molybdopterin converting factor small subunit